MLTREGLLKSKEYHLTMLQNKIFNRFKSEGKHKEDIEEGDFNGSISDFVEVCLENGVVPFVDFIPIEKYIEFDKQEPPSLRVIQ